MRSWGAACIVVAPGLLFSASSALGYTFESFVTDGCHEEITADAFRRAKGMPSRVEPNHRDELVLGELPFDLPSDMADIGGATLLMGVRDPDLKGRHGTTTMELVAILEDPQRQREHCLRRPEHDEPEGSFDALAECREYVRFMAEHAVMNGLDSDGVPDSTKRTVLVAHFVFSGRINVEVPVFQLYMGQALHALQDSFAHTFRNENTRNVRTVHNFLDFQGDHYEERRDGPPHMKDMDVCDDPDERRALLHETAVEASKALLEAALADCPPEEEACVCPPRDENCVRERREQWRLGGIDTVLRGSGGTDADADTDADSDNGNGWMTFEAGCVFDNRWCDAQENAYRDPVGCECGAAGARYGNGGAWPWLVLLAATAHASRRRRRSCGPRDSGARAGRRSLGVGGWFCALVVVATLPRPASGQEASGPREGASPRPAENESVSATHEVPTPPSCVPGRQLRCPCEDGGWGLQRCRDDGTGYESCRACTRARSSEDRTIPSVSTGESGASGPLDIAADAGEEIIDLAERTEGFAVQATAGGALDHGAFALGAGARYRLGSGWMVGVDGEWNPWVSMEASSIQDGAANVYGTVIWSYPVNQKVALRTTVNVGVSVLLFDTIVAQRGNVGLYLGVAGLGVEYQISPNWTIVLDPAVLAFPIPQVSGPPLSYRQYRLQLGIQIG